MIMKKISQLLVLSIVMAGLPFLSTAQKGNEDPVKGNGKVITQDRTVTSYKAIKVDAGIDVELTQGSELSLKIEADENIIPIIRTEVIDGVLNIYPEKSMRNAKLIKVHLTFTNIDAITANGGCDITSNGKLNFSKLETLLNGGCDIILDLSVDNLICNHNGGCDAIFTGEAAKAEYTVTGGSDVIATKLTTGDCAIIATGGSDVDVNVSGLLSISASGASDVSYMGSPSSVSKSASGGSDIFVK